VREKKRKVGESSRGIKLNHSVLNISRSRLSTVVTQLMWLLKVPGANFGLLPDTIDIFSSECSERH
jgi:hypothetical protein